MAVEVPWKSLSADALNGIIESFVSREGTDYGVQEQTLENKCQQLVQAVKSGRVIIVFDEDSETCNLLTKEEWNGLQNRSAEDEYFGW